MIETHSYLKMQLPAEQIKDKCEQMLHSNCDRLQTAMLLLKHLEKAVYDIGSELRDFAQVLEYYTQQLDEESNGGEQLLETHWLCDKAIGPSA